MSERVEVETVRQGIAALTTVLDESRAVAEKGVSVDLAGLDAQVEQLCAAARAFPPPEARSLLDGLEGLAGALELLRAALARQRDTLAAAVSGQADAPSVRTRAAAAYARPPLQGPIAVPLASPPTDSEETP
jgi:hypothetical protein